MPQDRLIQTSHQALSDIPTKRAALLFAHRVRIDGECINSRSGQWRRRDWRTGLLTGDFAPIDFARNGESYGARGFTVRTIAELRGAVRQALQETRSTVIDIKVTPKSMTGGYEAWWRVGTAEVSANPKVVAASRRQKAEVAKAKKL